MSWSSWQRHFEANARRARPTLPTAVHLDPDVRAPLARTLAIFQAGETGEGRIAAEVRRARPRGTDDAYLESLRLFIQEEGTHAARLARLLPPLGGECLNKPAAERIFRSARRAMGVENELLVLLAAEVVAVVFYDALARGIGDGDLAPVLADLVADERQHLAFHSDFFRATLDGRTASFRLRFRAVAWAACVTVLIDHAATFRALGLRRRDLLEDVRRAIAQVIARVQGQEPIGPTLSADRRDRSDLAAA